MGVKGLWEIIQPATEKYNITILKGKVIAIDASLWIMQGNKSPAGLNAFIKIIFSRVRTLLRLGACPVFIFEGSAPTLKHSHLEQRHDYSFSSSPVGERTYLKNRAKECILLLSSLGIPYLQSKGEGEALCALLNSQGLVHGCITEDVDFFLYGGITLYRFFSRNLKDNFISVFHISNIEKKIKVNQRAMIAIALVLGCDFLPKGVPGVGKVKLQRLLRRLTGVDLLERFESWRKEKIVTLKDCETCDDKEEIQPTKKRSSKKKNVETEIETLALCDPTFPNKTVIDEYLGYTDDTPNYALKWSKPNFEQFQETMFSLVKWNKSRCRDQIIPILTAWVLQHPREEFLPMNLHSITKRRTLKGVAYLEVQWTSGEHYLQGSLSSLEKEADVLEAFPDINITL